MKSQLHKNDTASSESILAHYARHIFFSSFFNKKFKSPNCCKKFLPGIEKYSYDQSLAEQITAVHTGLTGH